MTTSKSVFFAYRLDYKSPSTGLRVIVRGVAKASIPSRALKKLQAEQAALIGINPAHIGITWQCADNHAEALMRSNRL